VRMESGDEDADEGSGEKASSRATVHRYDAT
jgi:hypothetical protein